MSIQKVKRADKCIAEITGIRTSTDGKTAVVEFTTALTNITPLNELLRQKFKEDATAKNQANFALYDDGWRIEKVRFPYYQAVC